MARVGILLSGAGTTYANLVRAISDGALDAEIAVVVASRPGVGGLGLAAEFGHPAVVAHSPDDVTAALRAHRAEWVAMCGWLRHWDPPGEFAGRTVNVHPSLLPAFGGKGMYGTKVHEAVIAASAPISGCTVHLVTSDYDGGPILAQRAVAVEPGDDAARLQGRVQACERDLYPRVLAALCAGKLRERGTARWLAGWADAR
ncbi:MAG: phosphoribosylglycinamide formyltransferase [Planctomycetes bacterium]|nr:phosphoribosylglycinamide formyltransferase [Planctomycetota bacterium]